MSGRQRCVGLPALVARSTLIVVAEPANPATRREAITLTSRRQAGLPVRTRPAQRELTRWRVREVLAGAGAVAGDVVEVRRAHDGMWLEVEARREFEQVGKIVQIDTYAPPPDLAAIRIVFLRAVPGGHELTLTDGYEALAARDAVLAAAARRSEVSPADIDHDA